ncbi:MAG: hypothetical protein HOP13_00415 [Alphaproteobacteria bacterium]|nr:hypothetical protein [Alphaproteobacteria bacterium]
MSATVETSPVRAAAAASTRRDRIVEHLAGQVAAAAVEDVPFQHFYLRDVFPADVYAEIVAKMPERGAYRPLNIKRWHNDKGESTRDQLFLSEGEVERIDTAKRDLWADITSALESDALRRAIFAKFPDDVAIRLGCAPGEVLSQKMYPSVSLVRDFKDYKIKPHPDGQPRVITMQFYLPHDDTQIDLGTSLYKKLPVAYRLVGRTFEEVKRFKFLPNSAYAFAVNECEQRQSYHGRELIGTSSGARDSILVMWMSSPMAFAARHNSDKM